MCSAGRAAGPGRGIECPPGGTRAAAPRAPPAPTTGAQPAQASSSLPPPRATLKEQVVGDAKARGAAGAGGPRRPVGPACEADGGAMRTHLVGLLAGRRLTASRGEGA
eukprot:scaffold17122_cov27-Prasinocladus_malaysianus.AAC.1